MTATQRRVRIAAQLHPQHGTYRAIRDAAVRAEELGYDVVYTWDHFFPLYGDPDGSHFECWSLLAAWAEATERIELGPLVTPMSYRNPHLLADVARTVDHISDGRVILGIGAGWKRRDYEEYGYPFGTFGTRIEAMGAAIPEIRRRLDALRPPPVRDVPLLIAGQGRRRTLRYVATYADAWHAGFPDRPDELEPVVASLRDWAARVGRDPSDIEWSVGVEPDDLERFFAEDADTYLAMGFTQFTLGFNGPAWTVDGGRSALAWRDAVNVDLDRVARYSGGVTTEPSTPAIDALAAAGTPHRVVRTERARSAEHSAELQGIPVGALLRTIVVRRGEDDYLFVVVPAGRRFDWPKLRTHVGVRRMTLPDAEEARSATGYERYTITPFGSTRPWPVIVDAAAMGEPVVAIGGGGFGINVHLTPDHLVGALDATVADVSVPQPAEPEGGDA